MSEAETIIVVAFLFSTLMCLAAERETYDRANSIRLLLIGNAAFSMLILPTEHGGSFRGLLFNMVLAIGSTECGFWAATALNKLLPDGRPRAAREAWGIRNDPFGCGITLVLGITLLVVLSFFRGFED
ncbi:hypothetical protein OKA06_03910 [Novosphingobium sp. MW5]|nr:hypothetical protein [Novosphingobium sp. MW5]